MKNIETMTVGEIVAQDYRTATVFNRFKIDFCCKGQLTIDEACRKKGVDKSALLEEIKNATADNSNRYANSWTDPSALCDHIESVHHAYVETAIQHLKPWLEKIEAVHGNVHPEISEIKGEFLAAAGELAMHMKKEEIILFPHIRKMDEAVKSMNKVNPPAFGTVQNPINMMEHEHQVEGDRFEKISRLSDNYTAPADACNTYRVTFALLKEFEEDLKQHIHLENNVLFPMALKMENDLNTQSVPNACRIS